ncbi:MAG: YbdK family carboxylate-amine ligase [Campylobacteraceae bacterium]|nr:YbdK family carboxylate-amine ligase [Campylobacteraceae bacterium]
MDFEKFKNGKEFSLGAELELRLLHKDTLRLANEFSYIYENLDSKYQGNISHEFLDSMVEINSPVFDTAYEIREYFQKCIKVIKHIASKKSLLVSTSGCYSLKNDNIKIASNPRYKKILEEHQILIRDFNICGLHVHVGFKDFDQALQAYNFSLKYLPLFLAISTSSPFYDGKSTGLHSYRQIVFDELPKAGIPQYFDSYAQIKELYDLLKNTGVIESQKDIWWDIRIQPNLKTIEFRVCDANNDFERIEILIALTQAICKYSMISKVERLPRQVLKQNLWSAVRYGLDANLIFDGKKQGLRSIIRNLSMEFFALDIIDENLQKRIEKIINEKSISTKMIEKYEQSNSLLEVEKMGLF